MYAPAVRLRRPLLSVALATAAIWLFTATATTAPVCGLYVSTATGTDSPSCGMSSVTPCKTIAKGIARALELRIRCLVVQAGTYNEIVHMAGDVTIDGGYDAGWVRGPYTTPANQVRIVGGLDAAEGQYVTIVAHDLSAPARIANLIVVGPNASGTSSGNGLGSYGIHVRNSRLFVRDVRIEAGSGAPGAVGSAGGNASMSAAQAGGPGGDGAQFSTPCNTARGAGGVAGSSTCGMGAVNSTGGGGGPGGAMDTNCGAPLNLTATSGIAGSPGVYSPGAPGDGGLAGLGGLGAIGQPGLPGQVTNGAAGLPADTLGMVIGDFWYATPGGAGQIGENGGGGGGGGGGAGDDTGIDSYGAGGGGGGAGGCRAPSAGGGGGGGGGSYGLFAVGSRVDLFNMMFIRGMGGAGGAGGSGGKGQSGGMGGPGGVGPFSGGGGAGGNGAHGGHGGGGAGGSGGNVAGIFYCSSNSVLMLSGIGYSGGAAGAGGVGGISAPAAAGAEDDGNDGAHGLDGNIMAVLAFAGCTPGSTPQGSEPPFCDAYQCVLGVPSHEGAPGALAFSGVSPNPVTGSGAFRFVVPHTGRVRIELLDQQGRRVVALANSIVSGGSYTVTWDGSLDSGRRAPPGLYLARFDFDGQGIVRRVVMLR